MAVGNNWYLSTKMFLCLHVRYYLRTTIRDQSYKLQITKQHLITGIKQLNLMSFAHCLITNYPTIYIFYWCHNVLLSLAIRYVFWQCLSVLSTLIIHLNCSTILLQQLRKQHPPFVLECSLTSNFCWLDSNKIVFVCFVKQKKSTS